LTVLASAGMFRIVSGPTDGDSARARGLVRPPPTPEDVPSSVEVPRLEPPPQSLEAMVQSAPRKAEAAERSSWPLLVALILLAAVITAYVSR
jgi:hypothetical protein